MWFKVVRPDWIVQEEFEAIWIQNGGPVRAALFCVRNLRHQTNEFYFTPEAAEIAQTILVRLGGVPSGQLDLSNPTLLGPSLLVGDERILEEYG